MSFVKEFFRTILPEEKTNQIRVMLCEGKHPDIIIYSESKSLLEKLARVIQDYATKNIDNFEKFHFARVGKPAVFEQLNSSFSDMDIVGNNKYQITLNEQQLKAICDYLKIGPADKIQSELRTKQAVLGDAGHQPDNKDKLEIDYSQPIHNLTLEEFKTNYQTKSHARLFRDPRSYMLNNIHQVTLDEVKQHAKNNPSSVTADTVRELKFGK